MLGLGFTVRGEDRVRVRVTILFGEATGAHEEVIEYRLCVQCTVF